MSKHSPRASPITVLRLSSVEDLKALPKRVFDDQENPFFTPPVPEALSSEASTQPASPAFVAVGTAGSAFVPIPGAVTQLQKQASSPGLDGSPSAPMPTSRLKMQYEKNSFQWHSQPIDNDNDDEETARLQVCHFELLNDSTMLKCC